MKFFHLKRRQKGVVVPLTWHVETPEGGRAFCNSRVRSDGPRAVFEREVAKGLVCRSCLNAMAASRKNFRVGPDNA